MSAKNLPLEDHLSDDVCNVIRESARRCFGIDIDPRCCLEIGAAITHNLNEFDNPQLIAELLFCAKQDYEAARTLLGQRIFSLAVFHVQQAVEKLTKAYALNMGVLREEELYRKRGKDGQVVGHITPRTFVILLRRKGVRDGVNLVLGAFQRDKVSVEERLEKFEKLINKSEQLLRITKKEIKSLIEEHKAICANLERFDMRKYRNRLHRFRLSIKSGLRDAQLSSGQIDEVCRQLFYWKIRRSLRLSLLDVLIVSHLYVLSIITFPHFACSRYPDGKLKPIEYAEGLGIVDSLGTILSSIGEVITKLEKLRRG